MKRIVLLLQLVIVTALLLLAQQRFEVMSVLTPDDIQGRPVQRDKGGKLLPWPIPEDTGYSYNSYLMTQWNILWDQFNRQRYHYFFCCFDFDRTTFEMQPDYHWANSTGYLRAMMQGFMERLYPYTGDPNTITFLQDLIDYELENGLTPDNYAWARVPYASANPGDIRYTGWSVHGEDYVEPHVVGEDGYGYLRFYEMTAIPNTCGRRSAVLMRWLKTTGPEMRTILRGRFAVMRETANWTVLEWGRIQQMSWSRSCCLMSCCG